MNGLDNGAESVLIKSANNSKLGAGGGKAGAAIQTELETSEDWAENKMKFHKDKGKGGEIEHTATKGDLAAGRAWGSQVEGEPAVGCRCGKGDCHSGVLTGASSVDKLE